jgi:asparagine synthase (glutamine-hydrolysing)
MCGIAGFGGFPAPDDERAHHLRAMCGAIKHRGPDDDGFFLADSVALGMRRLSVIDVEGGAQPIANEDQTVHVVFNGEIYNHRRLRAELAHGHTLRSRTDTEVLVHLYEEHGEHLVDHLRGMFGFAIWDSRRSQLLLARDRIGIKPLYYWSTTRGIAFASELRSLLALPWFPRTLDPVAVAEYVALGYVADPRSIFQGVRKLPPGHTLTWRPSGETRLSRYWSPVRPEVSIRDDREAIEELQRLLRDAVESHLESDVPLGAFLSGGIDSSTVVAEMVQHSGQRVRTFSIGFDEREFDEAAHAARVSRELGTEHTELIVRPNVDVLIESVIRSYDEPFGDSSALPTMLVSQLARRDVTVALSGDGGDELFGGYTRYAELLDRQELPGWVRPAVRSLARRLPQSAPGRNRLIDLSRGLRGRYGTTIAQAVESVDGGVIRNPIADAANVIDDRLEEWFEPASERGFLTQMTLVDIASYLPGDILTKVDRASMSVSLEARVPLLDHPLVEFAVSLPDRFKVRDGVGKWILRQAVRDIIPASVLSYPKRGFAVPLDAWFRNELDHRLTALMQPGAAIGEFVDRDSVNRLVREHRVRRRNHGHALWRLLVLELWLQSLRSGELADPVPEEQSSEMLGVARSA